ncbi:MAG: TolC family protein [Prevotella sp.]|nr:TolC family protein [Prevotella sp.]
MRRLLTFLILTGLMLPLHAQKVLSLDSCRAMALRNNKQLSVAKFNQEIARYTKKAMATKYLPKVDAVGGYELMSKEISLLNNDQKTALNNLGSNLMSNVEGSLSSMLTALAQNGIVTPAQAQTIGQIAGQLTTPLAQTLNAVGTDIRKAFRSNNRNMMGAAIMVRQPLYMGGAISAGNKMAEINEDLTAHATETSIQNTIYGIDETYWLICSLKQKNELAKNFLSVIQKLDSDVKKMINEGVATRADGLKVSVKVNEAEMMVTQAEDGLSLAKMLLCQQCGLPLDTPILLADEDNVPTTISDLATTGSVAVALDNRPELKMLSDAKDISEQNTRLVRALYLPQIALTGGYLVTNPSVYNGFENKFSGVWNIGILVRVPVWSWQEGSYKIRASKVATSIANLQLEETKELIELQVNQNMFKLKEANKKYVMTQKNVEKAEENLRCANVGFQEGVMTATEVMEAQTAWLQAKTQHIDASIDVRLSETGLKKAMGVLD